MSGKYYQVERILDKKISSSGVKYLIKWVGWPVEESTWEPLENLGNVMKMVNEFETNRKKSKEVCNLSSDYDEVERRPMKSVKDKTQSKTYKRMKDSSYSNQLDRELSLREDSPVKQEISTEGKIYCDIPNKIISAKLKSNREVMCLIEWKKRFNGQQPENSWVSNKFLRDQYALLLVDYYESKLQAKS